MAEIRIPKCPNCGTDKHVSCSFVRDGDKLVPSWYCAKCNAAIIPVEETSGYKPVNERAAASLEAGPDDSAAEQSRILSDVAGEEIYRKVWVPAVLEINVSSRTDEVVKTKQKELETFIKNKKESTAKLQKRTYNLLGAGFVLLIVLFVLAITAFVIMCVSGNVVELYWYHEAEARILYYAILPLLIALEFVTGAVAGRGLYLRKRRIFKAQDYNAKEIADKTARVNGEISAIVTKCRAEVREQIDSKLVKAGFNPTADDELKEWWHHEEAVEQGKDFDSSKKAKGRKKYTRVYCSLLCISLAVGLTIILWLGLLLILFTIFW